MGFVPFPDVASVEMIFTQDNQRIENRYYIEKAAPFTEEELEAAAAVFVDWWDTNLKSIVHQTVSLVLVVAKAQDSQQAPGIEYSTGLPIAGTSSASPAMPNNVSVAVKWSTGLRGRSFRGRTYHIGLTDSQVNGNTLETGLPAQFATKYFQLVSDLVTAGFVLVVASRVSNGVERVSGVTTPIFSASVDATIDSQRRRLPGRGR